jgi:hypothetical protein
MKRLIPFLLATTVAFAGGSTSYDTPSERDCAKKVSDAIKREKATCVPCVPCGTCAPCPDPVRCPQCGTCAPCPEPVEKLTILPPVVVKDPSWFLDMGAQYVSDPGVFVGPRREWASGWSLALHGVYEWADGGEEHFVSTGSHPSSAPKHFKCKGGDRYGVALMVSVPLR